MSNQTKYRPDIDGLRAIAILPVLIFHAFPSVLPGGFIGVDIFFVISGYLISTILFKNLERNTFSISDFYIKRIKRIFPALTTVLIATLILGSLILISSEFNLLGKHVLGGATFISNLMLWSEDGYFDISGEYKPLLHLWSLGIEEQFYIFWPILLYFLWKLRLNILTAIVILILTSFTMNLMLVNTNPTTVFFSPFTRMWELLFGSLLAWVMMFKPVFFKNLNTQKYKIPLNITPFIAVILFSYSFLFLDKQSTFPGWWPLIPIIGSLIVISIGENTWFNKTVLSHHIIVWFGLISYPLYLWHWPLLSFGNIYYDGNPPLLFKWLAIILSITLAWLTVKFIEKPFRYNNNYQKIKITILITLMSIIAIIGFIVYKTNFAVIEYKPILARRGFEHLYSPSFNWYQGKDNWLFLGNGHNDTVAKLKLSNLPSPESIDANYAQLKKVADTAKQYNTKVVLIMGPNKSSIYPEFLPTDLAPSKVKYSHFFLEKFKEIDNLIIYDPTIDLLNSKDDSALLYYKTDTHWNSLGAFKAYSGMSNLLNIPMPNIKFDKAPSYSGDLISISKLKDFPLGINDNWKILWPQPNNWTEKKIQNTQESSFGNSYKNINTRYLSDKYVWIIGDSFTTALKPYFNATFKEVDYLGHWTHRMDKLAEDLQMSDEKPDIIFVIRVERTF